MFSAIWTEQRQRWHRVVGFADTWAGAQRRGAAGRDRALLSCVREDKTVDIKPRRDAAVTITSPSAVGCPCCRPTDSVGVAASRHR